MMLNTTSSLRKHFPFPFEPYDVQNAFMTLLYSTLQDSKVGIFESPTGTGKSLSLLCGSLTWLRDHEKQQKELLESELSFSNTISEVNEENEDWFIAQSEKKAKCEKLEVIREEYNHILCQERRIEQLRQQHKRKQSRERPNKPFSSSSYKKHITEDDEVSKGDKCYREKDEDELLLQDYHSSDSSDSDDETEEVRHVKKIYFCSRTHSQLSQFVHEIQQSPFKDDVRVVTLGSRQNLCINDAVQKLKNLTLINDQCLQMQKNKSTKGKSNEEDQKKNQKNSSCLYHRHFAMNNFRDNLLIEARDIEEMLELGREFKACPYYSSRYGIPEAELVVLPYNIILQKSAREACGIKLEGNIVIIDEAHNLIETLNSIYSVEVQGFYFTCAHSQLNQYLNRYRTRLHPKNLMYIKQILFILSSIIRYLSDTNEMTPDAQVMMCRDFMTITKIDNINLYKILKYCENSQICQKLHGFSSNLNVMVKPKVKSISSVSSFLDSIQSPKISDDASLPLQQEQHDEDKVSSPLLLIKELFKALTNPSKDGRIVMKREKIVSRSRIKFMLLNPAAHFQDVVMQARSVILAGGTMQPVSEFIEQLLIPAGAKMERIVQFSCGHVIPKENLLTICLSHGPTNKQLEFTYQNRASECMMDEVGRALVNLCTVIHGGVVCFFPSYEYEDQIYKHWKTTGIVDRINAKKRIFREPRKSADVAKVLDSYAKSISFLGNSQNGALLLSVVGGKMSEGINFADHLGRCVIVIGMPYPNMKSPELKEKIDYLNANFPKTSDGRLPGQVYYENLCMKAVNQSIGRAIRHKNDYACILLLDSRYQKSSVQSLLPKWVASDIKLLNKFGIAFSSIRHFFLTKASKK